MTRYAVVLFPSTHDAIRGERVLRPLFPVTLMPTPRRFSESCGISLRFDEELIPQMQQAIAENNVRGKICCLGDDDAMGEDATF